MFLASSLQLHIFMSNSIRTCSLRTISVLNASNLLFILFWFTGCGWSIVFVKITVWLFSFRLIFVYSMNSGNFRTESICVLRWRAAGSAGCTNLTTNSISNTSEVNKIDVSNIVVDFYLKQLVKTWNYALSQEIILVVLERSVCKKRRTKTKKLDKSVAALWAMKNC